MPWSSVSAMDLRQQFIREYQQNVFSVTYLAEHFGISRKTAYKWIARFAAEGTAGLVERSRRPQNQPNRTPDWICDELVRLHKIQGYGAKKVRRLFSDCYPFLDPPALSTVTAILERNDCVTKRKRRPRVGHPGRPHVEAEAPNDIWAADFKGEFKTRDGIYCYPLTITDQHSRFIIACTGVLSPSRDETKPIFLKAFREYGLPSRIRTDNGGPFASIALGRLSRLSVWWIRLGILPQLIEPGRPDQNGRHERMHKTLKDRTTRPPAANRCAQQRKFNEFVATFNTERPHESLGQDRPAAHYVPSPRPYPENLPPVEYPAHFEVRRVANNSCLRWRSRPIHVTNVLAGEYVGLEEIDNDVWDVYFGPVKLGQLDDELGKIVDVNGKPYRTKKCIKL